MGSDDGVQHSELLSFWTLCCNFILPPEGQAALLSKIYSQGTDPKENTFSKRYPTMHALLCRV
jgi:hypothetical protein